MNGDRSTRGGDGTLGTTGGAVVGTDGGGSEMTTVGPPPEGFGLGMNTGEGDLLLMILL